MPGHAYQQVGARPAIWDERQLVVATVERRDWQAVVAMGEFDATTDNFVVWAVSCPNSRGMALLVGWAPFAIGADSEIVHHMMLTSDEAEALGRAVPAPDWQECE